VNDKGELLTSKRRPEKRTMEKIADAVNVNTLTALNGKLYATNNKNELMKMDPLHHDKHWINIGPANNMQSITSHGERLFAIDTGRYFMAYSACKNGVPWTEIGRYNGITFNIHIKQIAVVSGRFMRYQRITNYI